MLLFLEHQEVHELLLEHLGEEVLLADYVILPLGVVFHVLLLLAHAVDPQLVGAPTLLLFVEQVLVAVPEDTDSLGGCPGASVGVRAELGSHRGCSVTLAFRGVILDDCCLGVAGEVLVLGLDDQFDDDLAAGVNQKLFVEFSELFEARVDHCDDILGSYHWLFNALVLQDVHPVGLFLDRGSLLVLKLLELTDSVLCAQSGIHTELGQRNPRGGVRLPWRLGGYLRLHLLLRRGL